MKLLSFSAILLALSINGFAHGPGHGPQLTDEQRTCLEGKIGKPAQGQPPSPEQMQAAFNACGVQAPQHNTKSQPELTPEQKNCLEGKIGASETPPSKEKMEAAIKACGISLPK